MSLEELNCFPASHPPFCLSSVFSLALAIQNHLCSKKITAENARETTLMLQVQKENGNTVSISSYASQSILAL